ncbi:DUF2339 domain-containing protein [Edaphobacter sp.]|uniref:DUF2339 domain-containing protein n=1 Tax=Edaphobacter sp. TaxID=1934404 RepID=UPI002DB61712|nr:DUF2339 domain-containing protein [Edaphobacter sp.]HEU5340319.1 DUF2339 domain-containing protein [Edaphobacter sp.]
MAIDENPAQPTDLARELAALTARVYAIERQLAGMHPAPSSLQEREYVAPPPKPEPSQPVPVPSFTQPPKPQVSLENRIGSQIFSRIGIIALLIGATLFLKYAMDNHWIGPLGRVIAGLVAGTAIVVWSERFRRKGFPAFSYSLKAVGSGALYLSLWAAFQLYHLMPAGVALALMVLVTAWNAFMAWSQSSEILAAYALAGGFATPLLLSTGSNHEVFLFTYILAIDIAAVALVRLKSWPRLLLGAFPATVAFFIGWYMQFNTAEELAVTSAFVALFFLTFIVPSLRGGDAELHGSSVITEVLLPLANAVFGSLAFYSLLEDSGHHALLPWMAVAFGAIYLGLMRLPAARVTAAMHLSLAIVFLTIAIPLKASGRWITIGWLAEGVALLWISARLAVPAVEAAPAAETTSVAAHRVLRLLSIATLALGWVSVIAQPSSPYYVVETAFLNRRFATSLFGVAAFALSAWIALRASRSSDEATPRWRGIAGGCIIAFNLVAVLACVREIYVDFGRSYGNVDAALQRSLAISAFLLVYGAALLAVGFWKRSAFIRWQALVLLIFTIGKTFVYDVRDLGFSYHIISFLALGAVLMAISFAYQKDWLALRDSKPHSTAEPTAGADQ